MSVAAAATRSAEAALSAGHSVAVATIDACREIAVAAWTREGLHATVRTAYGMAERAARVAVVETERAGEESATAWRDVPGVGGVAAFASRGAGRVAAACARAVVQALVAVDVVLNMAVTETHE